MEREVNKLQAELTEAKEEKTRYKLENVKLASEIIGFKKKIDQVTD